MSVIQEAVSNVSQNQLFTNLDESSKDVKVQKLIESYVLGIPLTSLQSAKLGWQQRAYEIQLKMGLEKPMKIVQGDRETLFVKSLMQRAIVMDFDKYSEETTNYLLFRNISIIDAKEKAWDSTELKTKAATFIGFSILSAGIALYGMSFGAATLAVLNGADKAKYFQALVGFILTNVQGAFSIAALDLAIFGKEQSLSKEQFEAIDQQAIQVLGKEKVQKALKELGAVEPSHENEPSVQQRLAKLA